MTSSTPPPQPTENPDDLKQFLPHIDQLRKKALSVAIVFLVFFATGFLLVNKIIALFLFLFDLDTVTVVLSSPFELFNIAFYTGLFLGIICATPVLMYQFFSFISPAFPHKSSVRIITLMLVSAGLFLTGFVFGLLIMKTVISGFSHSITTDIENYWNISLYLSQVIVTSVLMGVILQFPLVLACVIRLGLTDTRRLRQSRKMIILGLFIFAALLPTTDPVSLILITAPIIVLFELTLLLLDYKKKGGSG
ncbi:MAG: twin-arginine translocase subunit TatC [Candidatus Dojkabacteria bacterium]|nr:twin-arginine translocase subunit TatC [Candidatus Dojkabacteria bacterium]